MAPDASASQSASPSTADQNANATADQSAAAPADQNATSSNAKGALPQTASPLPLLGLLGFGSMLGGLLTRRRK